MSLPLGTHTASTHLSETMPEGKNTRIAGREERIFGKVTFTPAEMLSLITAGIVRTQRNVQTYKVF